MRVVLMVLSVSVCLEAGTATDLRTALSAAALDPAQCYRIRDVHLVRDEARFFFTDGYVIFSRPAADKPAAAFFTTGEEGGDAELLLLPPLRNERRMLSEHTGSPNLEEHFHQAALVFTAETYNELLAEIASNPFNKKSAEMGLLLADRWSPLIRTLSTNFSLRLAADFLSAQSARRGFFAAALAGNRLGAFNVVFDPRIPEQLLVGATGGNGFEVWASFTSRSFRGKPFAPEFAVRDYRIDSRLDADLTLHSVTRLTVQPASTEAVLPFEITDSMQVTHASVAGAPAELLLSHEGLAPPGGASGLFIVVPKHPIATGEAVEIIIEHEGKVIQDAGHRVFSVSSRGSWYPTRGRQFARFDLTFRLPKELDLVAAGNLLEDRIEGSARVSHWKTSVPIRLAGFNLGVYDRIRATQGGLTIEVCANRSAEAGISPPASETTWSVPPLGTRGSRRPSDLTAPPAPLILPPPKIRLQALAVEIGGAIEYYTARFGPLQLNRLEVTPVPGRFGQGFPGLIYLSTLSYLEPGERAVSSMGQHDQVFFTDLLHAHEAAHQWWGNIVTSPAYHDDWLMEALANYSSLLYLEKRKGVRAVDAVLEDYRLKLLEKLPGGDTVESAGPVVQGTRLSQAWVPIVYGKGTWILHMLRRQMGDAAFLSMLGSLRQQYEFKTLGTEEFRAFAARFLPARSSDSKLESFFDQWVYGTGVPELKLTSTVKKRGSHWLVGGTITQTGVAEEFAAEVPIEIQMGKSGTVRRTVTTGPEPATFEFALAAPPQKVSVDWHAILHR